KAPDYSIAKSWIDSMDAQGVRPNVDSFIRLFSRNLANMRASEILETYSRWGLQSQEPIQAAITSFQKIGKIDQALYIAVDYPHLQAASKLIREIMVEVFNYLSMVRDDGTKASLASYNNLIVKAPDYDTAISWLNDMSRQKIAPDAVTYRALIMKSPDFKTGKQWLEAMVEQGVEPDDESYESLFGRSLADVDADELLSWFRSQPHKSVEPLKVAILAYQAINMPNRALRIALE
ncbi:MAG: hypothetical protein HY779_02750, partial [Rubrobacteridae bacterium]|nr:hypothetical protein [Rubrobacteridae bacterium]